jgi:hypothetical protein
MSAGRFVKQTRRLRELSNRHGTRSRAVRTFLREQCSLPGFENHALTLIHLVESLHKAQGSTLRKRRPAA